MVNRLVWNFEFSPPKHLLTMELVAVQEELKWEKRYFWPQDRIICFNCIDNALLDLGNYQQKHKEDCYYLIPGSACNIKRRRDELLYKPLLKQSKHSYGFGAKINLDEPPHDAKRQQIEDKGIPVFVRKEAFVYKFPTVPTIRLELARLEIENKVYFSACIEGKSQYLVETISSLLLKKKKACDYVSFLKKIIKS